MRINLRNEEEATEWLQNMQQHSLTTYRVTRTSKPGLRRVLYKSERHCQHFRKKLSEKQTVKSALAQSKKARRPLTAMVRDKKTQCPSNLILTVQVPTKKQRLAAESKPHLITHNAVLKLQFTHNHPITSAHVLSFRDILEETKQAFFTLFDNGHSPSSARHAHEQALYLQATSEMNAQKILADRANNPLLQDICRLFTKWRELNYGKDDGKELFQQLQEKVDEYNTKNRETGGKAILQWYESLAESEESDGESETKPPPLKKKKKRPSNKPLILAVCTPLMARAHKEVCQAGEIVFCDASSSMDRFNTSLFMLSTTHACSGIPLAVFMVSDETEETVKQAMETVKQVLPSDAFYGNGPCIGPAVFMIDDSIVEQAALSQSWPSARLLLCTFHFLQRRWTWLHDGKNKIQNEDRITLIQLIRTLVYCKSEKELQAQYVSLTSSATSQKYPHFIKHMTSLWEKRSFWAHCFRTALLIRGNHTNNYAEAGIKILKELVFGRVKAYNLVQMFYFVVETLELYYKRKLVSVANNRLESYIALRFQGLNAKKISKEDITKSDHQGWYKVRSQTVRGKYYDINTHIGVCTCPQGLDGSPCSHQAAVVVTYGDESCNYIATISASARRNIAKLALGEGAIQDLAFYTSVHQKQLQKQYGSEPNDGPTQESTTENREPNFEGTEWDLIRAGSLDDEMEKEQIDNSTFEYSKEEEYSALCDRIDAVAETLKNKLKSHDPQLTTGVSKFLVRFDKLSGQHSSSKLATAFHQFG